MNKKDFEFLTDKQLKEIAVLRLKNDFAKITVNEIIVNKKTYNLYDVFCVEFRII